MTTRHDPNQIPMIKLCEFCGKFMTLDFDVEREHRKCGAQENLWFRRVPLPPPHPGWDTDPRRITSAARLRRTKRARARQLWTPPRADAPDLRIVS